MKFVIEQRKLQRRMSSEELQAHLKNKRSGGAHKDKNKYDRKQYKKERY